MLKREGSWVSAFHMMTYPADFTLVFLISTPSSPMEMPSSPPGSGADRIMRSISIN
jgi:hypothetical protein|tara:strand:- start:423 stop:590 length:168 start_codon:yes stop_codon:yes gene_type:complete